MVVCTVLVLIRQGSEKRFFVGSSESWDFTNMYYLETRTIRYSVWFSKRNGLGECRCPCFTYLSQGLGVNCLRPSLVFVVGRHWSKIVVV